MEQRASPQIGMKQVLRFSALLYYHLASEVIRSFGDQGKEAIAQAIENLGRERGEAIRQRVLEQGLPLDLQNLGRFYDLPIGEEWKATIEVRGEAVVAISDYCPFAEVWLEHNAPEVGALYCKVDNALRKAYNPAILFHHETTLLTGGNQCELVHVIDKQDS